MAEGPMTSVEYRDDFHKQFVQPFYANNGHDFVFQGDYAQPHRAAIGNQHIQEVGVRRMDWPAMSPYMNPIEHAWDVLKKAIRQHTLPPKSLQDLWRVAEAALD